MKWLQYQKRLFFANFKQELIKISNFFGKKPTDTNIRAFEIIRRALSSGGSTAGIEKITPISLIGLSCSRQNFQVTLANPSGKKVEQPNSGHTNFHENQLSDTAEP